MKLKLVQDKKRGLDGNFYNIYIDNTYVGYTLKLKNKWNIFPRYKKLPVFIQTSFKTRTSAIDYLIELLKSKGEFYFEQN